MDTARDEGNSQGPAASSANAEPGLRIADLLPGKTLPVLLEPPSDDFDLGAWTQQNRRWIGDRLHERGALLWRGFGISSVEAFEAFAQAACGNLFGEYGDLPSAAGGDKVYQSTPYPATKTILFHNESSHMHRWPLRQMFFCLQPSQQGGETPIVDCRQMLRALPAQVVEQFATKKLLYVRNFSPDLDVSWQDFFRTSDRAAVEAYCRGAGIDFAWTEGALRTRQQAVAVARHPVTGEEVFFNQVQLHHPFCLEPELREALGALFPEEDFPRNVLYGDGSPIEDEVMDEVSRAYWSSSVSFPWRQGDILMLDNMLVAHARNPYTGPRRIVVAMGEMFEQRDLARSSQPIG
jgi:hypothetical protein